MDNAKMFGEMNDYCIGKTARGVYRIYNLKTDRSYFGTTEDIVRTRAEERFRLDLGLHSSRELQKDYSETGLELFVIDMAREAEEGESLPLLLDEVIAEATAAGLSLYH